MTDSPAIHRLTDANINAIGQAARATHDQIRGNCRFIAEDIRNRARDEYDVELGVQEVQVGEARETHFLNTLPPQNYAGDTECKLIIDAALDQFCAENHRDGRTRVNLGPREWLPAVAIYPPDAEERRVWYTGVNAPMDGRDVFSSK